MAARSLWTGALSFGLVNVPVRLYSATRARELSFHMLHAPDDGRIHFKRVCSVDGAEVPFEEIVKGYEISRGQYVRIDPDELAKLRPRATHTVDIEDFVKLSEIDPVYFDATYHVAPDKGAGRAFALLREAMVRSKKVAVGRMVLRTRQYLCAVRPAGAGMMLSTMLFADEVVAADDLDLPTEAQAPKARELEMAERLVESLSARWDPAKYKDDYREQVLAMIHEKAEGHELTAAAEPELAPVVNLADALERSLAQARKAPAKGERRAARERPAARQTRTSAKSTKRRKSS